MKKAKQTILAILFTLSILGIPVFSQTATAAAAKCYNYNGTQTRPCKTTTSTELKADKCYTEVVSGPGGGTLTGYTETSCDDPTDRNKDGVGLGQRQDLPANCEDPVVTPDNCQIVKYLVIFINVLTAIAGLVVVLMIIVGGIQYSAARDNPQAVQAAKGKITNALLGLIAYIFTSAFLQWIVPGGII